ncbi:MAG: fatty-acid synthase [Candidatus Viridilinea halotolerans]|uniref:Fatty-acid synthase n=1 Tax=Candidatus Viridilinea halotolerans TaxID=2491704 RepID=A0A426TS76_9CHLR|nr:MAG: fatty-acid synthase [Candidatus Viridilinea halotolerans]
MPARDIYHHAVKAAIIADGWTITHDPYRIEYGGKDAYVDLGAEQASFDITLAAERDIKTIAVEIKTFTGLSILTDLQHAIGQYLLYRTWMRQTDPQRLLYLAVDMETASNVFAQEFGRIIADDVQIRLIVVDISAERILEWKHFPSTDR